MGSNKKVNDRKKKKGAKENKAQKKTGKKWMGIRKDETTKNDGM
jgi:hypothetical protein